MPAGTKTWLPGRNLDRPTRPLNSPAATPLLRQRGNHLLQGYFSTLSTIERTLYVPPSSLAMHVFPAASHHRCQAVYPPAFPLRQALATSRTNLRRDTGQVQGQGGRAQKECTFVQLQESPDGEAYRLCNAVWRLVFICEVDLLPMHRAELPKIHPARTDPALVSQVHLRGRCR